MKVNLCEFSRCSPSEIQIPTILSHFYFLDSSIQLVHMYMFSSHCIHSYMTSGCTCRHDTIRTLRSRLHHPSVRSLPSSITRTRTNYVSEPEFLDSRMFRIHFFDTQNSHISHCKFLHRHQTRGLSQTPVIKSSSIHYITSLHHPID